MSTLFTQIQFKDCGDTLNLLYGHHYLKGMVSKREKCNYIKQRERNKGSIDAQLVFWHLRKKYLHITFLCVANYHTLKNSCNEHYLYKLFIE